MTASRDLDQWLRYLQSRHTQAIELGLARVAAVAARLDIDFTGSRVITVAGTNGKGSCVAMLDTALRAVGLRTGTYTSPHLRHFSERVCVNGTAATDDAICGAFAAVETAAGDAPLTWFEFTTLAILQLLSRANLDVCILEVGLGGRLDAVNIVDPDIALVTSIGLDHTDWLGDNREAIGREKAGIFRADATAICAEPDPPASIAAHARDLGCRLLQRGIDFDLTDERWIGVTGDGESCTLPRPDCTLAPDNIAGVLQVLQILPIDFDRARAAAAITGLSLAGRQQQLRFRDVDVVLDVAHNVEAVERLAAWLDQNPHAGRTVALFATMADKPVGEMLAIIAPRVDSWWLCDLPDTPRAMTAAQIAGQLPADVAAADVNQITLAAVAATFDTRLRVGDRLLVFGSFYLVGPMLSYFEALPHGGNTLEAQHA